MGKYHANFRDYFGNMPACCSMSLEIVCIVDWKFDYDSNLCLSTRSDTLEARIKKNIFAEIQFHSIVLLFLFFN